MPTHPTIVHGDDPDVSVRILNILPEVRYRRELSTTRGVRLILGLALPQGPQQDCELMDQVEVSE